MIPESFIEELKYASNIEEVISSYVNLKRAGSRFVGLCPFHSEKTPSFSVSPESGFFYCFGCSKGGDVITFIREVENLEYIEAIRFLAQRAGLTVPEDAQEEQAARVKARVLEMNREAARFFHKCLMGEQGKKALFYLSDRGLSAKTIKRFGLGYAPPGWDNLRNYLQAKGFSQEDMIAAALVQRGRNDGSYDMFRDRVIFPIIDLRGGVIGFGGRLMEGTGPKYLNSPDTPVFKKSRNLFALNFAKASKSDDLVLGEGYMDVIAMHQAGIENAVATLGTSLTAEQSRLLARYAKRIVIAYDSDSAGQNAAKRAINLLGQNDVQVSVLEMRDAKDPDEYIKKFGAQRFQNLISSSKSAMSYEIEKLKSRFDLDDADERVSFLNAFCGLMADIQGDMQRDVYIGQIAREMDVSKERISATVQSLRKKKVLAAKKRETHNMATFTKDKTGPDKRRLENPNIGGFLAEENMIAMLLDHPDYLEDVKDRLGTEDFYDPCHRQIFHVITRRILEHQSLDLIHLSASLTPEQMARLSQILAKSREIKFYREQAEEYCQIICGQKEVKNIREVGEMSPEEYDSYIASLTAQKK